MGKIKLFLFVLIISLVLSALYISVEFSGILRQNNTVNIVITKGESVDKIISSLKEKKVIGNPLLFKSYIKISNKASTISFGEKAINTKMSYKQIVDVISDTSLIGDNVIIPEGFELKDIANRLVEKKMIKNADRFLELTENYDFNYSFIKNLKKGKGRLEGYLFPATYTFKQNTDEILILDTMLKRFEKEVTPKRLKRAEELNLSFHQAITLASIIEREAKHDSDFKLVSSVFHNRLKANMLLQSCATVQYILGERKTVLTDNDTKINSPYNTYQVKGLPPSPIASPGVKAIDAALYPEKTNDLFFFSDKNDINHYSKTFDEHTRNISKYGLSGGS